MTSLKTAGKVIVVLTFIVSLNPYLLIFTIPVFIIGLVLIWLNSNQIFIKALWTFLPILLWYPAFFTFMYLSGTIGKATAQKLDFIFSADFEGKVIAIEKMCCGQPLNIVNGREQLFIPKNGVLLYQGELKTGYVNHKYYRLQPNGQKLELSEKTNYMYFDNEKAQPSTSAIGAWLLGTGSKILNEPKPLVEYSYMNLLVSSKDSTDKYYEFNYNKNFESLTDSLVRKCD